jgi:hypothetical protein
MSIQGEEPRAPKAQDGDKYDFRAFLDRDYQPKIRGVVVPFIHSESINYQAELQNFIYSAGDLTRKELARSKSPAVMRFCQGVLSMNNMSSFLY